MPRKKSVKKEKEEKEKKTKKKSSKKKTSKKKKSRVSVEKVQIEMQPIMVENFISLQKVMLNLSEKFEKVNTKLTNLLELFETSAKTLAKKDFKIAGGEHENEMLAKINDLSEQNKVIAKGLTMIHEKAETAAPPMPVPVPTPQPITPPAAAPPAPPAMPKAPGLPALPATPTEAPAPEGQYKKSAAFKPLKPKKTSKKK